jgi:hypothetical protein
MEWGSVFAADGADGLPPVGGTPAQCIFKRATGLPPVVVCDVIDGVYDAK